MCSWDKSRPLIKVQSQAPFCPTVVDACRESLTLALTPLTLSLALSHDTGRRSADMGWHQAARLRTKSDTRLHYTARYHLDDHAGCSDVRALRAWCMRGRKRTWSDCCQLGLRGNSRSKARRDGRGVADPLIRTAKALSSQWPCKGVHDPPWCPVCGDHVDLHARRVDVLYGPGRHRSRPLSGNCWVCVALAASAS